MDLVRRMVLRFFCMDLFTFEYFDSQIVQLLNGIVEEILIFIGGRALNLIG